MTLIDKAEALEPCPFCGGDDMIILNGPVEDDWCAVSCEKCHARGPTDYTDPHAIAAWNRRAALLARLAAQEAQMKADGERASELMIQHMRCAEAAETALAAERAKVAKLVEYYEASEAILSIEAEWRSRKADGLLDGSNIFNLTDKLTAAEARLAKARAAITEAGQ